MVGTALTAFLGGKGTLWGPPIGALIVVSAQQYFAFRLGASDLYLVSYAAIFLVVILLLPRGVIPSLGEWIRGRQAKAPVASASAPAPDPPAPAGATRGANPRPPRMRRPRRCSTCAACTAASAECTQSRS